MSLLENPLAACFVPDVTIWFCQVAFDFWEDVQSRVVDEPWRHPPNCSIFPACCGLAPAAKQENRHLVSLDYSGSGAVCCLRAKKYPLAVLMIAAL